jgi:hypothetical protein
MDSEGLAVTLAGQIFLWQCGWEMLVGDILTLIFLVFTTHLGSISFVFSVTLLSQAFILSVISTY